MASLGPPLTRTEGVPDKGGRLKRLLRRPLFPFRLRLQGGAQNQADIRENRSGDGRERGHDATRLQRVIHAGEPLVRCLRVASPGQASVERCA